jgi:hypothetical protein
MFDLRQRLTKNGHNWKFVSYRNCPRFTHRMLPWKDSSLIAGDGRNMRIDIVTCGYGLVSIGPSPETLMLLIFSISSAAQDHSPPTSGRLFQRYLALATMHTVVSEIIVTTF